MLLQPPPRSDREISAPSVFVGPVGLMVASAWAAEEAVHVGSPILPVAVAPTQ
jgi:hypothetical protein